MSLSATSTCLVNNSRDCDSTPFLGSLLRCLITLSAQLGPKTPALLHHFYIFFGGSSQFCYLVYQIGGLGCTHNPNVPPDLISYSSQVISSPGWLYLSSIVCSARRPFWRYVVLPTSPKGCEKGDVNVIWYWDDGSWTKVDVGAGTDPLAMASPNVKWVRWALLSQFTTHLGCKLVSPQ